ncbi:amidohydrolase [Zavarzinia sp. CC-PAN008]|uniref:amidohydrolase n=1 Tax=Zavarzinia sp. CC-PAN008 TaxID=3243332 RepID=UPI003F74A56D
MTEALKRAVCARIDDMAGDLLALSHAIHAKPELAFEEVEAVAALAATAERAGLRGQVGAWGLPTAFEASFGSDGPLVGMLAEYDALPGIGHACGHNLIATASTGAALGLLALGRDLPGRVRLIGTPAEEAGGGKELMRRAGAFAGLDAAMMIHPSGMDMATMPTIAIAQIDVIYHGKSAHASAMPHLGVNALDAVVLGYQAIAALRQHIRHTERLHGIITDGGQAPNIVPERAAARYYARAANATALAALKLRVEACLRAGAEATGCTVELNWAGVDYLDLNTNWPLAGRYQRNGEALGRHFIGIETLPPGLAGSTDMGNVSHDVPAIHPLIQASPPDVVIHNPAFTHWAGSAMGDRAALDGAKALAMTAIDFMCDAALREEVVHAFDAGKALSA